MRRSSKERIELRAFTLSDVIERNAELHGERIIGLVTSERVRQRRR
jgi:hypothetical protein